MGGPLEGAEEGSRARSSSLLRWSGERQQKREGRSRAGVVLLAREESPERVSRSVHPHRLTYLLTHLPTYLAANLRLRLPAHCCPQVIAHSLLLILTPRPSTRHAYSPPRGRIARARLDPYRSAVYTLANVSQRRTLPTRCSQLAPDCPAVETCLLERAKVATIFTLSNWTVFCFECNDSWALTDNSAIANTTGTEFLFLKSVTGFRMPSGRTLLFVVWLSYFWGFSVQFESWIYVLVPRKTRVKRMTVRWLVIRRSEQPIYYCRYPWNDTEGK